MGWKEALTNWSPERIVSVVTSGVLGAAILLVLRAIF